MFGLRVCLVGLGILDREEVRMGTRCVGTMNALHGGMTFVMWYPNQIVLCAC